MTSDFQFLTLALLVPGILWASWIDYSQRRVPNWLNLTLILLGFAAQGWCNGWSGMAAGFWGMAAGFGLLIVPWLMHGMGAGDVKLMAAIGVWLGPWWTLWSFVVGALIGAVTAIVMISSTGRLRMAYANFNVILTKCANPAMMFTEFGSAKSFGKTSQLLPYGVPLTAGTLLILAGKMFGWWGV